MTVQYVDIYKREEKHRFGLVFTYFARLETAILICLPIYFNNVNNVQKKKKKE